MGTSSRRSAVSNTTWHSHQAAEFLREFSRPTHHDSRTFHHATETLQSQSAETIRWVAGAPQPPIEKIELRRETTNERKRHSPSVARQQAAPIGKDVLVEVSNLSIDFSAPRARVGCSRSPELNPAETVVQS